MKNRRARPPACTRLVRNRLAKAVFAGFIAAQDLAPGVRRCLLGSAAPDPQGVPAGCMSIADRNPWRLRLLTVLAVVAVLLGNQLPCQQRGDLQSQISTTRSAAACLHAQIAADWRADHRHLRRPSGARDRLAAIQRG